MVFWLSWFSSITIEPAIMLSKLSHGVSGVLRTDLAMSKICFQEMGFNATVCENLKEHKDVEIQVQKRFNKFEMYGEIMTQVPTAFYALIAGSIADRFGKAPLLILPIIGQILEGAALLLNKLWFSELPLEALWLSNMYHWLGGGAVWYLGMYSFAADITTVEERASRMARFDGFEQTAYIVGTALSPIIYKAGGYETAFCVKIVLASVSLCIISRYLWKQRNKKAENSSTAEANDQNETLLEKMLDILLGMIKTVFKKRAKWMTLCLLLQIGAYTLFYTSLGSGRFMYLYTRKVFGWTQDDYIVLKVMGKILGINILVFGLPALKHLKISDVNLLILFNGLQSLGFMIAACSSFSEELIYLGCILIPFHYPKYAVARSLMSQAVDKNEVGRVFSCLSLLSALVPFFVQPMFAFIYQATLDNFTGAFMIFTSLLIAIALVLYIFVKKIMTKIENSSKKENGGSCYPQEDVELMKT